MLQTPPKQISLYQSLIQQVPLLSLKQLLSELIFSILIRVVVIKLMDIGLIMSNTEQEFGSKIHILVNFAGVMDPKGAFLCSKEAANRLARGGGGRIILILTSVVGGLFPGYGAYPASKAAVETMAKIMAKELKGSGITVNCVAPGPVAVATELFFAGKTEETVNRLVDSCPLGRFGQPDDVRKIVGFLVGDDGEWINGQIIRANGGSVV
ncbi:hypothetical protein Q3G72_028281 [Acer saccharum]|nr:hypothetical protein Q3G72_028281 [Acer saccharum]